MIAQKEIAKALGVSAVTVSRALRGHPDLAKGTRERILQKAQELGYPPLKERGGSSKMVKRVGVLLYERESDADQIFWGAVGELPRRIIAGIQKEAQKNHFEFVFEIVPPSTVPLMIRNRAVGGVIVMGRYSSETLELLRSIPAISVSNYIQTDWMPRIVTDNLRGMSQVTEHLISLGHKKILFLGNDEGSWTELHRERERGYRLAMAQHGLAPEIAYCPVWDVEAQADLLLRQTAIAASTDSLVLPLQDFLRKRGKVLPRDCSLAGFDGNFQSGDRGITTYAPDWNLMGKIAADYILSRAENVQGTGIEIVVPGRLIVRDSSQAV